MQLLHILSYIIVGVIGSVLHYLKKRYVDNTTDQSFHEYLFVHKQSTFNALAAIVSAEYALSMSDTDYIWDVQSFIGALTAGYNVDSVFNRSDVK